MTSLQRFGIVLFLFLFGVSLWAGRSLAPTWGVERSEIPVQIDEDGVPFSLQKGEPVPLQNLVPAEASALWQRESRDEPPVTSETVRVDTPDGGIRVFELAATRHWGMFSLLPALAAVVLCFLLREPVLALSGGILCGALILRKYDIPGEVLVPAIGSATGATIIILYLWFLGGLMGIWSKSGAALAFANWVTRRFVRGPRGAKFVSWLLGVSFFQGGTLSTVLVGTSVRPVADRQRVSHEELAYVVDATAAPIAVLLPFNAWPIYVQSFIFLAGVPVLATEADRITFFFQCIPLYFYAIFSVLFTLLLCFDKLPFMGRQFREAVRRARETGQLDRPGAEPLLAKELEESDPPEGYRPHYLEFLIPLAIIIGVAVGTFFFMGSPQVMWAFGLAIVVALGGVLARGMRLSDVVEGLNHGLKGVVYGSAILLLAIVVGGVSREVGAGPFLVESVGDHTPVALLPVALVLVTMVISFSTGTSWGTFAVSLPLAMPLAWAVAQGADLQHPVFYLSLCFAAVINGSVFGDQCSPISDTTVLSCVSTGCDLMDHVKTQIVPCSVAALIAMVLWTLLTFFA